MNYIVKRGMISIVMVLALMALLVGTMMDGTSPEIRTYAYDVGEVIPESDFLTFTAELDGSSVTLKYSAGMLQYNKNQVGWVDYTKGTQVTLNNGESVRFRGTGVTFDDSNHVALTGKVACSGDVMSLRLDGDNKFAGLSDNCFSYMFSDCTSLTTAPALSATTLADGCYVYMFQNCTSLTTAPALSATTLEPYCYAAMFAGCASLTTAPALPATTLAYNCYKSMFYGCTSLTIAPALPATTLAEYCYDYMFAGCESLTTAPELPATTLAVYCYRSMFAGCTSLTTAPDLPATTLVNRCYSYMFKSCTKIDLSAAPDANHTKEFKLPGTGEGNQYASYMFSGDITTPQLGVTYYIHEEASQTQIDPAYTITIPAAVNIDGGEAVIGASGVTLPAGKTINVTISGANTAAESDVFTAKSESGNTINYQIIADKVDNNDGTLVANGQSVLSISENGDFTKTLTFEKTSAPLYAGKYTEALTFTVSVESA